jgi:hypothetical protein
METEWRLKPNYIRKKQNNPYNKKQKFEQLQYNNN